MERMSQDTSSFWSGQRRGECRLQEFHHSEQIPVQTDGERQFWYARARIHARSARRANAEALERRRGILPHGL